MRQLAHVRSSIWFAAVLLIFNVVAAVAAEQPAADSHAGSSSDQQANRQWEYGGFADIGYLFDVNDRTKKTFRSRGTTWHLNELDLNMVGTYVRKRPSNSSRLGAELLVHAGKDDAIFGFSATAPNLAGHEWLRHVGLANVSYLAPVGSGLTVQAGIFTSLIGYDSLYAKDNFNYTRPWGADFTPYLMLGVNASYPITAKLTGTLYVVNGYWHLANPNRVPSGGGQVAFKATPTLTLKETVVWGPHQPNTALEFWRFLSDTIIERRTGRIVVALNAHFATETVDGPARPRAWWVAAQLPMRWTIRPAWTATVRPEIAWDSDGRWTLAEQTVKAITSTVEYRVPYKRASTLVRVEHRVDDSRGPGGGFLREAGAGVIGLTPTQHLLIVGLVVTFDSPSQR